ncbi:MAG: tetratricopeptide repeat protein [Alphaproteobacteria bacterium]|nr:tetratricopeptide repeat protein [Alphaproteobacteria bacterium]
MRKKTIKTKQISTKPAGSTWSTPIYVYWFIILFFIAATFYILGRSHGMVHNPATLNEEILMQASDYFNAGKDKLAAGDIEGAIADLSAVVDSGAVSGAAYLARGEAYMLLGDYKKAMSDFNSSIEHDTTNVLAFYDRALLEMRLEDYDSAMIDINNALVVAATHPTTAVPLRDLYAKRGQLNLWQKNWDGAIADYTNSLAHPDGTVSPAVYAERAEAYTAKGDYTDAITDYASAMQIVKEQLNGVTDAAQGEKLSRDVMLYSEKSAALYLKLNKKEAALTNLEGARQIANALNDTETVEHLDKLISDLQDSIVVDSTSAE